jgi:hypothetical protein
VVARVSKKTARAKPADAADKVACQQQPQPAWRTSFCFVLSNVVRLFQILQGRLDQRETIRGAERSVEMNLTAIQISQIVQDAGITRVIGTNCFLVNFQSRLILFATGINIAEELVHQSDIVVGVCGLGVVLAKVLLGILQQALGRFQGSREIPSLVKALYMISPCRTASADSDVQVPPNPIRERVNSERRTSTLSKVLIIAFDENVY